MSKLYQKVFQSLTIGKKILKISHNPAGYHFLSILKELFARYSTRFRGSFLWLLRRYPFYNPGDFLAFNFFYVFAVASLVSWPDFSKTLTYMACLSVKKKHLLLLSHWPNYLLNALASCTLHSIQSMVLLITLACIFVLHYFLLLILSTFRNNFKPHKFST